MIQDPRPFPECYNAYDSQYGLPSSQHVYLLSVVLMILINTFWKKNITHMVVYGFVFVILLLSSMYCWISGMCNFYQNVVTALVGILGPVGFMTIYHYYYFAPKNTI